MKRFTTVHPLYMSFYSKALYRDVGGNWRKVSFAYLFLLLSVCLIPIMFRVHASVSDYVHSEVPKIIRQVPIITIAGGTASVNEKMPYTIKDPGSGAPFIIIDTTGQTTSLKGSDAIVLLTKSKLLFKRSAAETRTLDLSELGDLTIDQARLYDWTETFLEYFIFALYPFALLLSFLFRILEALVFGFIAMLLSRNIKAPLRYQASVSIAIVSMTPAIITDTLYSYSNISIPFWWFINFILAVGYLFFAVKANAGYEGRDAAS